MVEKAIEIEGKTVQDAIEKGLKELGLNHDQAEIKILSEGTPGLFGLMGSKAAKISIQPKTGGEGTASPVPFSAPQNVKDEMRKFLSHHLSEIVKQMNLSDKMPLIKVEPAVAGFSVEITFADSTDGSLLIGKGGRTLSALGTLVQSILNHEFRSKIGESPLPKILIDVNHYRIRQEEKMKNDVARVLENIRRTGKPHRLNPMPARMRRIVHLSLAENPEFESFSEGEGDNRRVIIRPRTSSVESKAK